MKTNGSVTEVLATYIRNKPVTDEDLKAAGRLALDAIANMIAGRNSETGNKLLTWANSLVDSASNRGHLQS